MHSKGLLHIMMKLTSELLTNPFLKVASQLKNEHFGGQHLLLNKKEKEMSRGNSKEGTTSQTSNRTFVG